MNPPPRSKGRIIVFGILFWYPLAGVTYQFLHFLIGLRRLGYDPFYIEDSGRWIYDPKLNDQSPDASGNIAAVVPALEAHGFGDRWAFRGNYPDGKCYGMSEEKILRLYREADAFLNVTGSQELRPEHLACPRRIYVETDPVVSQIKVAQGEPETIAALAAHDTHFSYGGNFGAPDCRVPLQRFNWLPTRQPVLLDLWQNPAPPPADAAFNTIATWKNKGRDIVFEGPRVHENRRPAAPHHRPFRTRGPRRCSHRAVVARKPLATGRSGRPLEQHGNVSPLHLRIARRVHRRERPERAAAQRLVQ
jgi:hypothetical protein